jgi:hypothetical protein
MSKSNWGVVMSIAFALFTWIGPVPESWKPLLGFIATAFFAFAVLGWLMAHVRWFGIQRARMGATSVWTLLIVFCIGGGATIGAWLLVDPLKQQKSDQPNRSVQVRFEPTRELPIRIPPRQKATIVMFRDDFSVEGMQFSNSTETWAEWPQDIPQRKEAGKPVPKVWPPELVVVATVLNTSDRPLFNVAAEVPVEFFDRSADGKLTKTAAKVTTMVWDVVQPAGSVEVFLVNQSKRSVTVNPPRAVSAEIDGARHPVAVKQGPFGILDQLPGMLPPTNHEWVGDRMPEPFVKPIKKP